mgnify:CR=1 FL=1
MYDQVIYYHFIQLFELLGFDQFEFIQELLSKRQEIVAAILQAPASVAPSGPGLRLRDMESKPNYGAQVTIQVSGEY